MTGSTAEPEPSKRSLHKPVPNYCEASGVTGAGDNLQKLRAGSRELGFSKANKKLYEATEVQGGMEETGEMFSKQHCWNAVLPTLTPSSALWSAAACVTNRGSRAWKFPSQTHLQPTQRFRHPPPCFLRIFLLSYLASCRQQAPGSGTAALITRCANLVPRHVNCLVLPALARPGGDSVHQAVTFRTTNAWPGTPLIFSCTSTTPELGWMCPIPSSVCLPALVQGFLLLEAAIKVAWL